MSSHLLTMASKAAILARDASLMRIQRLGNIVNSMHPKNRDAAIIDDIGLDVESRIPAHLGGVKSVLSGLTPSLRKSLSARELEFPLGALLLVVCRHIICHLNFAAVCKSLTPSILEQLSWIHPRSKSMLPRSPAVDAALFRLMQLGEQVQSSNNRDAIAKLSSQVDEVLSKTATTSAATLVLAINRCRTKKQVDATTRRMLPAGAELLVVCRHQIAHEQEDVVIRWLSTSTITSLSTLSINSNSPVLDFAPSFGEKEKKEVRHFRPY